MNKWKWLKKEKGAATIVEMSIVFPIVLFIVLILIYLGNVYLQMSQVEAAVARTATYTAGIYADPLLETIGDGGGAPKSSTDIRPYRYLFGNSGAESVAQTYLSKEVKKINGGVFSSMKPRLSNVTVDVKNYVFYQVVSVSAEYQIQIPVYFLGKEISLVRGSVSTSTCVSDGAEFIRNMNMAEDFMDSTGLTEKLEEMKESVKGWFGG